ncbi:MAG: hypothetical protein R3C99_25480 [Pirellulaceae bacterium]
MAKAAAFEMPLPLISEPQAYRHAQATLTDRESEIETIDGKLAETWQVKQDMSQELLTGRIRLVARHRFAAKHLLSRLQPPRPQQPMNFDRTADR